MVEFHTNQSQQFVKVPDKAKDKGREYRFHMLNLQDENTDC